MPINKRNPGLAPSPSRGGPRASSAVDKGCGPMKAHTDNRPDQKNRSNAAYNMASKEANAPSSTRRPVGASCAHDNASFKGIGSGIGSAPARANENIRPKSAQDFDSFSNVGGSTKTSI